MARGWESKSVEDQIGAAEAETVTLQQPALTAGDRELRTRRQSLELSRARVVGLLAAVRNERYRSQLERALEDLEAQLAEIEAGSA